MVAADGASADRRGRRRPVDCCCHPEEPQRRRTPLRRGEPTCGTRVPGLAANNVMTRNARTAAEFRGATKRPEAVSQRSPGSLGYARDLPTFWLESAPCPFVSGLVRGGGVRWPPPFPEIAK